MKRTYKHRFGVAAPIESVANFHSDTRALRMLTPMPVQFNMVEPLSEGSRADFTMWAGPIPIRWVALHSNVSQLHGFEDSQERGPFEFWHHKHTFMAIDDHFSEVIDEIESQFGKGFVNGLISRLMWWSLPLLFSFRGWHTKRELEKQKP